MPNILWMSTRLLAFILILTAASGCSSLSSCWNPDVAAADAEHDISSGHIRFAYVGGFAPLAPGVPADNYEALQRYSRLKVGPQGCLQDERRAQREEYARRYNEAMWGYVSKQH